MQLRPVRALVLLTCAWAVAGGLAGAQEADGPVRAHVRGAHIDEALLLDELVARSQIGRDLVDRLNQSDLLVYISYKWFPTQSLRGRIGFLTTDKRRRLVGIEVDCRRNRIDQLVSLAHELQHAVEIAGAPAVWDATSLAALYRSIGSLTGDSGGKATYETEAAAETGSRVRLELHAASHAAALAADDAARH